MAARKILIGPSSFAAHDATPLRRLKAAGYEAVDNPYKRKLSKDELRALLTPEVIGLLAGLEPLDAEVLAGSKLRVISRVGAGMSNVDQAAAARLGIAVRSTPDAPVQAVAELTLGAMLALLREIAAMDQAVRAGRWEKRTGAQLSGRTVAVVGFGRIGRRVGALAAAFGAKLLAVDPALSGPADGARVAGLAEALAEADIVTLHCAGERRLIGAAELARMKPGSYLLNAARGGLVDEAALLAALESGRLAGAWCDVFGTEPYAGPLAKHPRMLLTPHAGSYTRECRGAMELEAVENLLAALKERS